MSVFGRGSGKWVASMTNTMIGIWNKVAIILRNSIGQVFMTHLVYVALGVVLFAPLVGLVSHIPLYLTGAPVLADQDIIYFLLSPVGMLVLLMFTGLLISIIAFEQASIMVICAGITQGVHIGTMQAFYYAAGNALNIFSFSILLVGRVLLIMLPFLLVSGLIAWSLITQYDINYYLSVKPPVFLVASMAVGALLLAMCVVLARKLLSWSQAFALILFDDVSPARSFSESDKLTLGHKRPLLLALGGWVVATFLLGALVLGGVQLLGSKIAPLFFDSINIMVVVLGGLVAFWGVGNFLTTIFTSASFAALLVVFYERFGVATRASNLVGGQKVRRWRLNAPRFTLVLVGSVIVAVLVGTWLLDGIQAHDDVVVIAHRGAAGKAPENTLAAIKQAINDGADWVEIDVQETVDGEVVVIHDSDFMKLAGVNLKVWDGSLKKIKEIDVGSWFAPQFSAERVPTLVEVLEETRGKVRVMIELKYYGYDKQLEQRVVDIVERTDMVDDVAIMSLKYDGVEKIRTLRPDWAVGLLSAKTIGEIAVLDVDFLAVNIGMATPGFIRNAQSHSKKVFVWTVNDKVSMSRMMSLGIDGIITDEPELAREVLVERSKMNSVERLLIHTAVLLGTQVPQRLYRDESP